MPTTDPADGRSSVAVLVAGDLLAHDLPDATPAERSAAADYVRECVAHLPDSTRLGVRVAGAAVYGVLSVLGRGSYRSLPAARRTALAVRLFRSPLPVVGEFGTLTRGLGLVGAHEARYAPDAATPDAR